MVRSAGVQDPKCRGPILNRASMLIDAAIDAGIALARTALPARDLIDGRLVKLIDISLPLQKTLWIVNPKITGTAPKIAMIRKWLIAEATLDKRRLNALA